MPLIFLPEPEISPGILTITGEKARYLATVLRCRPGDPLTIKDSRGNAFASKIVDLGKKNVSVEITGREEAERESPLQMVLAQGLLKGEKMDLVIQKTTELGVQCIRPVVTGRSQVRTTRKTDRWKKIAEEASRQSGRDRIPDVKEPVTLAEFLGEADMDGIILWEGGGQPLKEALSSAAGSAAGNKPTPFHILVGPEGGFSAAEVEEASKRGFVVCSFGKRTLRAETASIAAVSITQYVIGDMGL